MLLSLPLAATQPSWSEAGVALEFPLHQWWMGEEEGREGRGHAAERGRERRGWEEWDGNETVT